MNGVEELAPGDFKSTDVANDETRFIGVVTDEELIEVDFDAYIPLGV